MTVKHVCTGADHIAAYRHWLYRRGWDINQDFLNQCTNCGGGPEVHAENGDDGFWYREAAFMEFACP